MYSQPLFTRVLVANSALYQSIADSARTISGQMCIHSTEQGAWGKESRQPPRSLRAFRLLNPRHWHRATFGTQHKSANSRSFGTWCDKKGHDSRGPGRTNGTKHLNFGTWNRVRERVPRFQK